MKFKIGKYIIGIDIDKDIQYIDRQIDRQIDR